MVVTKVGKASIRRRYDSVRVVVVVVVVEKGCGRKEAYLVDGGGEGHWHWT